VKKLLLVVPLLLGATACSDGDGDPEPKVYERTAEDDGSRIVLREGDQLVLSLEQCGGCGYSWEVVGELDPAVLDLEGSETREEDRAPGSTGGEVTYELTFTAEGEGDVTLAVGSIPPGEQPPDEVLTYEVRVLG
jgi:predicted secreted protein